MVVFNSGIFEFVKSIAYVCFFAFVSSQLSFFFLYISVRNSYERLFPFLSQSDDFYNRYTLAYCASLI